MIAAPPIANGAQNWPIRNSSVAAIASATGTPPACSAPITVNSTAPAPWKIGSARIASEAPTLATSKVVKLGCCPTA